MSRTRFSLRTLMIATTVTGAACFYFFVLPTSMARKGVLAVASQQYSAFDELFVRRQDRFLEEWADQRWGLQATAELLPADGWQLLTCQRKIVLRISYFHLDENVETTMEIASTPHGLTKPVTSSEKRFGLILDKPNALVPEAPVPRR